MIEEIHFFLLRVEIIMVFISFSRFSYVLWAYLLQKKKVPEIFLYAEVRLEDKDEMTRLNYKLYMLYSCSIIMMMVIPTIHLMILFLMPALYVNYVLEIMYKDNIKVLKKVRIDIAKIKK